MIELWSKSQIDQKFREDRREEILTMLLDPCADEAKGHFQFADDGSAEILEDSHDAATGTNRAVIDISNGPLLIVTYDDANGVTSWQGHYRTRSVIVKEYVPLREL